MRLSDLLSRRHEHRVLALMLIVMHGAIWIDFAGPASRSLILAHLGLFLLWQPIWRREERLEPSSIAIYLVSIAVFIGWLDWGLMTVWIVLLTGIVGGRMTEGRWERTVYMLTLIFLITELLIGAIPAMFGVRISGLVASITFYGLPAIAMAIVFVPAYDSLQRPTQSIDFLYGLTMSLLVSVLAMGTLLRMFDSHVGYPEAVFQTLIALGSFLLAISWLWSPFGGFSGLGQLWTRYLMNIGTPFEQWLARIADLSSRVQEPDTFIAGAVNELVDLPWVKGVAWKVEARTGQVGTTSEHFFSVADEDLEVTVYTHGPVGTTLLMHGRLLVALLSHFYGAKTREVELTDRAHLEAVHETGSRITHDIKNLLQSLFALTNAMQGGRASRNRDEFLGLLERQLPTFTQRLQLALDKLQAPDQVAEVTVDANHWWQQLKDRHENSDVVFEAEIATNSQVPADLFDSVAENLLENAKYKQQTDSQVLIEVHFSSTSAATRLTVRDTGKGIPADQLDKLLRAPIKSSAGLGIGLFQASRHATQYGFTLSAESVRDGDVAFALAQLHSDVTHPSAALTP
jgi:signal transduction histidine kinase